MGLFVKKNYSFFAVSLNLVDSFFRAKSFTIFCLCYRKYLPQIIYLFIYLFIYIFIYLFICSFIYMFIYSYLGLMVTSKVAACCCNKNVTALYKKDFRHAYFCAAFFNIGETKKIILKV